MRLYLAAPYSWKDTILVYSRQSKQLGFVVTSTWTEEHYSVDVDFTTIPEKEKQCIALRNMAEVDDADMLVFFSCDPREPVIRGGRHVEFGYALAQRKRIIVIGPRENIFHFYSGVKHFHTWLDAVEYLISERDSLHLTTTED